MASSQESKPPSAKPNSVAGSESYVPSVYSDGSEPGTIIEFDETPLPSLEAHFAHVKKPTEQSSMVTVDLQNKNLEYVWSMDLTSAASKFMEDDTTSQAMVEMAADALTQAMTFKMEDLEKGSLLRSNINIGGPNAPEGSYVEISMNEDGSLRSSVRGSILGGFPLEEEKELFRMLVREPRLVSDLKDCSVKAWAAVKVAEKTRDQEELELGVMIPLDSCTSCVKATPRPISLFQGETQSGAHIDSGSVVEREKEAMRVAALIKADRKAHKSMGSGTHSELIQ